MQAGSGAGECPRRGLLGRLPSYKPPHLLLPATIESPPPPLGSLTHSCVDCPLEVLAQMSSSFLGHGIVKWCESIATKSP